MDWAKELTGENFFAIYDIVLDIQADLQLGQQPCIPMVPSLVKFRVLMPADGINMRDRYGNLRWKAMKFLEQKGVIRKIDLLQGGHRWQTQAKLQVNPELFKEVFASLEAEFRQRAEPQKASPEAMSGTPAKSTEAALTEFEKVTLPWLVHHVPLKLWLSAVALLLVVFVGGVHVGQIGFVRELLGKSPRPEPKLIEPSALQERIDRLTEGYNANVREITSQILTQEQNAASAPFSATREKHLEAANRLRSLLDDEHKKYRAAIGDLRALQSAK